MLEATFCMGSPVTDMFDAYDGSFNEDIGAWDTSGVTTMAPCSAQPRLVRGRPGGHLSNTFYNTPCASTSCGIVQALVGACWDGTPTVMTDSNIRTAVAAWLSLTRRPPRRRAPHLDVGDWG